MQDRTTCSRSFALFDTALGRCGIAWSDRGETRTRLLAAEGVTLATQPELPFAATPPPRRER